MQVFLEVRMKNPIGRPRSEAAHEAILKSTLRLVTKRGFRAVTVNEIAADAGVGKMTLYRHWPNKAAVVMDSLFALIGSDTAFPKAGTALESIRLQLNLQLGFFRSKRGNLIRSLVGEAQSDADLAVAYRERWLNPRREQVRETILLAIAEGSIREDVDIDAAIDSLYAPFYYRLLLGSGSLDEQFIEALYRQFLEGHRAHKTRQASRCVSKKRQPR
jgi:AcrR family transcriptional regulator